MTFFNSAFLDSLNLTYLDEKIERLYWTHIKKIPKIKLWKKLYPDNTRRNTEQGLEGNIKWKISITDIYNKLNIKSSKQLKKYEDYTVNNFVKLS